MVHTVLVIETNGPQCGELSSALKERLGYRIISLSAGRDAAQYVITGQSLGPDIILFDISNAAQGCETIATLKALAAHIPVVALVKYGDYESAIKAMSAGAQDFLTKPVAVERISTTLHNLLLLREARREVEWLKRPRLPERTPAQEGKHSTSSEDMKALSFLAEDGHMRRMEALEAAAIRFAMQYYNGRMTEVARRLGIGRSTLYRKLNEFAIRGQEVAA